MSFVSSSLAVIFIIRLFSTSTFHVPNLCELFPNVCITLRILLTIPAAVASAETFFSKLKLVKYYLRSAMSQTQLVDLARLKVESCIARQVDFDGVIKNFANKNSIKSLI